MSFHWVICLPKDLMFHLRHVRSPGSESRSTGESDSEDPDPAGRGGPEAGQRDGDGL